MSLVLVYVVGFTAHRILNGHEAGKFIINIKYITKSLTSRVYIVGINCCLPNVTCLLKTTSMMTGRIYYIVPTVPVLHHNIKYIYINLTVSFFSLFFTFRK